MSEKHESAKILEATSIAVDSKNAEAMQSSSGGVRHIQSVVRALNIVEVIAGEHDGLTLSELSKRVGLNASTCHHLIATLVSCGYLSHLGRNRGYALGSKLHELVDVADGESDPAELL